MDVHSDIIDLEAIRDFLSQSRIPQRSQDNILDQFVQGCRVVETARDDAQRQRREVEAEAAQIKQEHAKLQEKQSALDAALAGLTATLPEVLESVETSVESVTSNLWTEFQAIQTSVVSGTTDLKAGLRTVAFNSSKLEGDLQAVHASVESGTTELKTDLQSVRTLVESENTDLTTKLESVHTSVASTADRLKAELDQTVRLLRDEVVHRQNFRISVNDSHKRTIDLLNVLSTAVANANNSIATLGASHDKLDAIPNVFGEVKSSLLEITTACKNLRGLPSAMSEVQRMLRAVGVSVGKIHGLHKAVDEANKSLATISSGVSSLHRLPSEIDEVSKMLLEFGTDCAKVDQVNRALVLAKTSDDKMDGISNAINRVEVGCTKLDRLPAAADCIEDVVGKVESLSEAVQRIETSYRKLDELPRVFHKALDKHSATIEATSGKLDGISNAVKRANDRLLSMEASSVATANLVKASDVSQKAVAESVVNIDNRLAATLTEQQFMARMTPMEASINATERAVNTLPTMANFAEISSQLASEAEYQQLKGRCDWLEGEVNRLNQHDVHRQNELVEATARLHNSLDDLKDMESRVGRRDVTIANLREIEEDLELQLEEAQENLDRDDQVVADYTERLRDAATRLAGLVPRADLAQAKNSVKDLQNQVARLKASLDSEKRQNAACLKNLSEQATKLESEQKRAERAETAKNELAIKVIDVERQSQTSAKEVKSLHQDLKDAWQDQKLILEAQVSDKVALLAMSQRDLVQMRSQFETVQGKLSIAEEEKANLQRSLEDANLDTSNTVTVPKGPLGDLAAMYMKLADNIRDIPTAPESYETFQLDELAATIGPLLAQFQATERLVELLNSQFILKVKIAMSMEMSVF
uniref:WGS project CBME000000000 data, contig CS3487_c001139 n=1 Tax=Fusarium pseudograminearum CS3487 TaxID=1318458 RepID=A0A096PD09_FUSPS|nr:unnamed protein product [Fusarium pseudograminearum CS3487]